EEPLLQQMRLASSGRRLRERAIRVRASIAHASATSWSRLEERLRQQKRSPLEKAWDEAASRR
ncbi:MAG: hypothetical protein V2J24_14830, partial [Pseudomonadales bacterium]|nr:hypothetical protein [Pseudomonadales bacterium]